MSHEEIIVTTDPTFHERFRFINGYPTLDQIRQVVREEVHKALHPEEEHPSATIEYEQGGQKWRGKVYLVRDEDEED